MIYDSPPTFHSAPCSDSAMASSPVPLSFDSEGSQVLGSADGTDSTEEKEQLPLIEEEKNDENEETEDKPHQEKASSGKRIVKEEKVAAVEPILKRKTNRRLLEFVKTNRKGTYEKSRSFDSLPSLYKDKESPTQEDRTHTLKRKMTSLVRKKDRPEEDDEGKWTPFDDFIGEDVEPGENDDKQTKRTESEEEAWQMVKILVPKMLDQLAEVELPELDENIEAGKMGNISFAIKDTKLIDVVIPQQHIAVRITGPEIVIRIERVEVSLSEFGWGYELEKFPKLKDMGKATGRMEIAWVKLTINQSAFHTDTSPIVATQIKTGHLEIKTSDTKASTIYNLILKALRKTMKKRVEKTLSSQIGNEAESQITKFLQARVRQRAKMERDNKLQQMVAAASELDPWKM